MPPLPDAQPSRDPAARRRPADVRLLVGLRVRCPPTAAEAAAATHVSGDSAPSDDPTQETEADTGYDVADVCGIVSSMEWPDWDYYDAIEDFADDLRTVSSFSGPEAKAVIKPVIRAYMNYWYAEYDVEPGKQIRRMTDMMDAEEAFLAAC